MKLGVCTGIAQLEDAARAGFDYIEVSLAWLASLGEEEFRSIIAKKERFPIPVLRCNGFLPPEVRVTGADASESVQRAYLEKAMSRAAGIGVKTAVFGSGEARNVPEGWAFDAAWRQIVDFLKIVAEYAEKHDMTVAIEPLRRQECNIINLVSEGLFAAEMSGSPRIGALGDTYHMGVVGEPLTAFKNAGSRLMHVHISHSSPGHERVYPSEGLCADCTEALRYLKSIGYDGSVSIEAGMFTVERGVEALKVLREAIK